AAARRAAALEAISRRLDGKAAAASTYRRKRAVFHHVLEYAVELGELPENPIHKVKFRKVKTVTRSIGGRWSIPSRLVSCSSP
ncbi:hypothetical protein AB0J28_27165, partial [Streptosporangium canum]